MAQNKDAPPANPRQAGYPDSGDVSGKGRERRDDGEVFSPDKTNRDLDQMGTHGGSRKAGAKGEQEG
jgi:hypothetical protein